MTSDRDKDSTDLAEDRTDWAEDRTVLANERTFAGWMRTGMSAVAIGIGIHAIFKATEPTWLAKVGALAFIAIGILIFFVARTAACKMIARLNAHTAEPVTGGRLTLIATAFAIASGFVGVILWVI
ncbi:MAG: DUF202 domain-containing protein [Pseudomonadota bacterium]